MGFTRSYGPNNSYTDAANSTTPEGFDIIIDDVSHIGQLTRKAFWHLFDSHIRYRRLGAGYRDDLPDGKNLNLRPYMMEKRRSIRSTLFRKAREPFPGHTYGTVGFVKQLVDEQAAHDVSRVTQKGTPGRASEFESLFITSAIVYVAKAGTT